MPQSSGQTIAAWSPAATPRRVWPSMMRAFFAAIEISDSNPATSPAPTAGPCIAARGEAPARAAQDRDARLRIAVHVEPDGREFGVQPLGGGRELRALLAHH